MKELKRALWLLVPAAMLIGLDQWTKALVVEKLKGQASYPLIPNVFHFTYVENRGAAFSILQGQQGFFGIITVVILAVLVYVWFRMPQQKRWLPIQAVLVLIMAGAIGNFIDRISQQYVVDFLDFTLIHFPVFNVADCYVTCSCILFVILFLFVYKDEELDALVEQIKPNFLKK